MKQLAIPCLLFRSGTSRGPFFLSSDLPDDNIERDKIILAAMGSPDDRQIDGIGGATTLTSKVVVLSLSNHHWADIDFLFGQVSINQGWIDWSPFCGNMTAGVAHAAIERGLISALDPITKVRIRNLNTNSLIETVVQTPQGEIIYDGNTSIDGVPGTAASVVMNFMEVVGSKTGQLLPTGYCREKIQGIEVTCIDVAIPMVIARAEDLGKTGYETKAELDADRDFFTQIETIRRIAGERMGLGDVTNRVIPKFAIIAPPRQGGTITSRYFVPDVCHAAHAVTGAICVGCCSLLKDSVADGIAANSTLSGEEIVIVEHPSGKIQVSLVISGHGSLMMVERAGIIRTVRLLFSGNVHVSTR
ncbi:4-oxalomesaconate tautomerase [Cylindrospermopsis raciborskii]|uniref:4-oxalomesaconate tautomerase n=2 Tax=Cylindrospermopsis raciborskii TaxID=77022 RepID=UPI000778D1FB|nr:4-oxalomesaconate tautomerase [Cylindrospermopsis raciborskii]